VGLDKKIHKNPHSCSFTLSAPSPLLHSCPIPAPSLHLVQAVYCQSLAWIPAAPLFVPESFLGLPGYLHFMCWETPAQSRLKPEPGVELTYPRGPQGQAPRTGSSRVLSFPCTGSTPQQYQDQRTKRGLDRGLFTEAKSHQAGGRNASPEGSPIHLPASSGASRSELTLLRAQARRGHAAGVQF
jgi:hypothetical protein